MLVLITFVVTKGGGMTRKVRLSLADLQTSIALLLTAHFNMTHRNF